MFYQCAAVEEIEKGKTGVKCSEWRVRLRSNNPPEWFGKHLLALVERLRGAQADDSSDLVRSIVLDAPD
jgi:hypothetical protein